MLPTPAPTTPRNSPPVSTSQLPQSQNPDDYPEAPQNRGTAPFSVLSGLFDKLQNERKPDKRKKFMSAWFDVRLMLSFGRSCPLSGETRLLALA
jgi:DNA ligase-4